VRESVFFFVDVSRKSVLALIQALDQATTYALTHSLPRVKLYIQSDGGDAYAGLSAMDHVSSNRLPVVTIADGFVASAATFILLGGAERRGMRSATLLIHQVSTGFWGKFEFLKDEMSNSEQLMETLRTLYTEKTKMTPKRVRNLLKKELTLSASQCVRFGIFELL
jgi:ATP-dependent protease ClpP protease subunit